VEDRFVLRVGNFPKRGVGGCTIIWRVARSKDLEGI
jgi:hypothetical protein